MKKTILCALAITVSAGAGAEESKTYGSLMGEKLDLSAYPGLERYLDALYTEKALLDAELSIYRINRFGDTYLKLTESLQQVHDEILDTEGAVKNGRDIQVDFLDGSSEKSSQSDFGTICGGIDYRVDATATVVSGNTHQGKSRAGIGVFLSVPITFPVDISLTAGTRMLSDGDISNFQRHTDTVNIGSTNSVPIFAYSKEDSHGNWVAHTINIPTGSAGDCNVQTFGRVSVPSDPFLCPGGALRVAVAETPEVPCG
ncbi:MAG: hypothetical protein AAGB27_00230 [Pseudomonadota bacterium]